MAENFLTARKYLAPESDTFWSWNDCGAVVTWRNGVTIAFRAEVLHVLERLAPDGWPPMDAVVMFLAACGRRFANESGMFLAPGLPLSWVAGVDETLLNNVEETLQQIALLPSDLRSTPAQKAELAALVFADTPAAVPPKLADIILRELHRGLQPEMLCDRTATDSPALLYRLGSIAAGLERVDAAQARLRQETGLEQLPQPAVVEKPDADETGNLLDRLEQDEEFGGLARLARQLMAALTLPRSVSEPDDLPLGGVSDISNRGSLDRLLVSELAHDDLTFMVRVALNEALYLRRETPPQTPPRQRLVLLDSGLRLWGVPRVFATAAALALAATRRRQDEFSAYRAREAHLDHIDLETRDGLVAHLAALEPDVHPGAALPNFASLVARSGDEAEPVLITGSDVLTDQNFRRALAQTDFPLFLLSVNRQGRLELWRRSQRGLRLLREMEYDLDRILAPVPRAQPLINPQINPHLPAILRLEHFPLLLPYHADSDRIWGEPGHGVLCVTHDQRLMYSAPGPGGGRQISDTLPPGRVHWHEFHGPAGLSRAVVGRLTQTGLALLRINLHDLTCHQHPLMLQQHKPLGVTAHAGAVFVIFADHLEMFDGATGAPLNTTFPAGLRWWMGRFFTASQPSEQSVCFALSSNGQRAVFEEVCKLPPRASGNELIGMFDSEHSDGPVGVTSSGDFRFLYGRTTVESPEQKPFRAPFTGSLFPPGSSFRFGAVSPDGRRLVLVSSSVPADSQGTWLVDLQRGEIAKSAEAPLQALAAPLLALAPRHPLRNRFDGIASVDDALILVGAKGGRYFRLVGAAADRLDDGLRLVVWQTHPARQPSVKVQSFRECPAPAQVGYRLSQAMWDDGSRAVLDSRGMLHLSSSDPHLPEITLVLGEKQVAGWCSDGRTWGPTFFTGDAVRVPARTILAEVLIPFVRRLR